MSEENRALVHRWFEEVWNQRRAEAIDELFAADGLAHGLGDEGAPLRGPEHFKPFHRRFLDAFPDMKITVEDTVCEGDMAVSRCSVRATHAGDGLGFAATNKPVAFEGVAIVRIEGGQIVE